jgi:hypothetical protein
VTYIFADRVREVLAEMLPGVVSNVTPAATAVPESPAKAA